jgi:predicted XRE-type DNA-binding protein
VIKRKKRSAFAVAKTTSDLGEILGLSPQDTAVMEFRTNLGILVARAIKSCGFTHEEIAKRAGTSRTRVTGIANQGLSGVSSDLMIRVLAATGHAVNPQLRKLHAAA